MKRCLHAWAMCQSMFCALPVPWKIWDEKARDIMLLFLPAVGLVIGLLWALAAWLCKILALPALIRGLILCVLPYIATGFIHLDGFMDVTDAVKSCRELSRRREILKDSHVGAFAVTGCVILFIAQFAFFASAPADADFRVLLLIPAVSRCGSALAVTVLPPMSTSQYAGRKMKKSHAAVICAVLAAALTGGFLMSLRDGLVLLACGAAYALALCRGYRALEGMNGDIAGYALTYSELAAAAAYALI